MRVLGERNWARPGKVRAGYDAWVLGMHAAHVGVCTGARLCRGQGKRIGSRGAAHLDFIDRSQQRQLTKQDHSSRMQNGLVETARRDSAKNHLLMPQKAPART